MRAAAAESVFPMADFPNLRPLARARSACLLVAGLILLITLEGHLYHIPALYSVVGSSVLSLPTLAAGFFAMMATLMQRPLRQPEYVEWLMWFAVICVCLGAQMLQARGVRIGSGTMGSNTALGFLLLAVSQFGYRRLGRFAFPVYIMSFGPPFLGLLGYLNWEMFLVGAMSLPTAILLLALSGANSVRFARRRSMRPLVSSSPVGRVARTQLIFWMGWLVVAAIVVRWLPESSGLAEIVLTVVSALAMLGCIVYLASKHDETAANQRRIERRLFEAVMCDPLTKAHTRAAAEVYFAAFGPMSRVGVILFEIAPLKQVNESHGYAVGDGILADAGKLLRNQLEPTELLVRWGGAQFLLLSHGIEAQVLEARATALRDQLGAIRDPEGEVKSILALASSACSRPGDRSLAPAVDRANRSLREEKGGAKGHLIAVA